MPFCALSYILLADKMTGTFSSTFPTTVKRQTSNGLAEPVTPCGAMYETLIYPAIWELTDHSALFAPVRAAPSDTSSKCRRDASYSTSKSAAATPHALFV